MLISTQGGSLRRYEQRLEQSEKTTSHSPGTTRMATAAHRARDRSASAGRLGTASTGKTGQRDRGDHRVGRGKTGQHGQPQPQPQPQPRKPFFEGKNKSNGKNGQRENGRASCK